MREIEGWPGQSREATSVFFGGGTPTLLAPADLARVLRAIEQRCGLAHDAEVTVEANPETVDETVFESLLQAGFNRVSIGVQSLSRVVLEGLGRTHTAERALDAVRAARRAGFASVNLDLIYGSPWETAADWRASLDGAVATGVEHISAYALTVEEVTPLATLVATGRIPDVDPDVQAERFWTAERALAEVGYERYEISNWCKPGHACRHNILYWSAGDYLRFGAGAHAHLNGRRSWSLRLPRDFIAAVEGGVSTEAGSEELDADRRAGEALMLGLRLASGVHLPSFERRFGREFLARRRRVVADLLESGLLTADRDVLSVPRRYVFVLSEIVGRLL